MSDPKTSASIPAAYIAELFADDEHLAVLAVPRGQPDPIPVQRILTAERAAAEPFQRWLRHLNANDHDVFVSMNPLTGTPRSPRPGRDPRPMREKQDVAEVRRLQLDLDEAGPESLGRLLNDVRTGSMPQPAAVLRSSRHRYQVVWHTAPGWTPAAAEDIMSRLAQRYGGDPAVADVARVMRLPGFRNKKDGRGDAPVTWTPYGGRPVSPDDFTDLPDRQQRAAAPRPLAVPDGRVPKGITQSERDWAYVRDKLRRGTPPEELIAHLERTRQDKYDPAYYAERTVNRALASLQDRTPTR